MIIPILSEETKEVFALILGELSRIKKCMGGELPQHNVTILMTYPLYRRLCFEHFGCLEPVEANGRRMELFGSPIRVVYGDAEEWFISVAHSRNIKKDAV